VRSTAGAARARGRPALGHAVGETGKKERREERKKEGERKKRRKEKRKEKERLGKRKEMGGEKKEKGEREKRERVGAGRGGDRGRSATRTVFARGGREKKRSCAGANHGGRSRVSDKPSSDAERDSDPVRVRVSTSNRFYELL
jgi:hypothetical protein